MYNVVARYHITHINMYILSTLSTYLGYLRRHLGRYLGT